MMTGGEKEVVQVLILLPVQVVVECPGMIEVEAGWM
jgi:hypothetical protein